MEERLKDKLKGMTEYYENILAVLNENTVLCGGLILQVMTNKNWETDVDIFTTDHSLTRLNFGVWTEVPKKREYIIIPGIVNIYNGKIGAVSIDITYYLNKFSIKKVIYEDESFLGEYDFEWKKDQNVE